jgi:hypothetical protein
LSFRLPIILEIPLRNANGFNYLFECKSFWQFPYEMPITVATLLVTNHSSNSFMECQQLRWYFIKIQLWWRVMNPFLPSIHWKVLITVACGIYLTWSSLDFFSVFNSYLKFHRFNLNKTNCIWNFTYLSTTFIKKYFKLSHLLVLIPVKSQMKKLSKFQFNFSFLTYIWSFIISN